MTHQFKIEVAIKYGVEEAVILNNLAFWIEHNKANNKHFYEDYYWTYNSARAFEELFPYFNSKKISRLLNKLEELGAIKSGNYNAVAYDRTKWYTICDKELIKIYKLMDKNEKSISQKCPMENPKLSNGFDESVQPIPYIKPYNKQTDKKQDNIIAEKQKLFDKWWNIYNKKTGKPKAIELFNKLSEDEIKLVLEHTEKYYIYDTTKIKGKEYKVDKDRKYKLDPERYLKRRIFEDEIPSNWNSIPYFNESSENDSIPGFTFDQQRYDRLMRTDRCVLTDKDLRYLEKCERYLGR